MKPSHLLRLKTMLSPFTVATQFRRATALLECIKATPAAEIHSFDSV
jgi:hypothetical protein